jgi:hypothetical protein
MGFLAIAMMCDLVSKEFDQILIVACEMEVTDVVVDGVVDNGTFLSAILNFRPSFTAGRFCSINRSVIFSVLNAFTTFLLVIVQLSIN